MNKFAGLNLDFGNVFLNGYGTAFTHVNANHMRLFPWNSLADATVRNTLKNVLDSAQSFGISVSIVLNLADISSTTGEERAFIRGYPVSDASPPYPLDIDKMKADFDALYAVIGSHPAIHSWDIHNEPAPWHYWASAPYRARDWCIATADYIRTVDTLHRPIYLGLSNLEASQTTNYNGNNMLLDANAYTDLFAFHYYPQLNHVNVTWTLEQAVQSVTGEGGNADRAFSLVTMPTIHANNPRNLPLVLDEFGIATFVPAGETGYLAYTDEAGQAAFYTAVFNEVVKYPEIIGINPWEALFTNRFSIFRSDGSDRPSALVVRDFYSQFLAPTKYAFAHWQDGDTSPVKSVNL